ncbi:hypothetical protein LTS18_003531 [Coniosporium uncinatum]|uniref:Uncharacterized protein n=1 Tax=Coniosporium uncinatum TaxID=93489 RepID=A0ACC3D6P3_9PEZI|nr:hypothetical protein LTS18_003531 [Coniosporium uncinatum]
MATIEVLLLDIEGTICPISFVQGTLFPYATKELRENLDTLWDSPSFQEYKQAFPDSAHASKQAFQSHVEDLTTRDVKAPYLKALQGFLWKKGYEEREYATPLFSDARALISKLPRSVELAIFSSGSIAAQKLLFQHVALDGFDAETGKAAAVHGEGNVGTPLDMRTKVHEYFDTTTAGSKKEKESYTKIAEALGTRPEKVLFLSDVVGEIDAARAAGMAARLVIRKGNAAVSDEDGQRLDAIHDFLELVEAFDKPPYLAVVDEEVEKEA